MRTDSIKNLVLASGNPFKLQEFHTLLSFYHQKLQVYDQTHFKIPSVEETGLTFIENALIKARHTVKTSKLPTLADDSGLLVPALNQLPGVKSARYAGEKASAEDNIHKLLKQMEQIPAPFRKARFYCVLVFLEHEHDPAPVIFIEDWLGEILKQPQGKQGFGYDSIFYVPEYQCSAAELSTEIKNTISHRGKAFRKFCNYYFSDS